MTELNPQTETMLDEQIVVFQLRGEQYGVGIAGVESIITPRDITRVPHAPDFVEGVMNLRGEIIPVVDLGKRFGLPPIDALEKNRIIVLEVEEAKVGMIVDDVVEVLRLPGESIQPPSPIFSGIETSMLSGIAHWEDQIIILLDAGRALSSQEQDEIAESLHT